MVAIIDLKKWGLNPTKINNTPKGMCFLCGFIFHRTMEELSNAK